MKLVQVRITRATPYDNRRLSNPWWIGRRDITSVSLSDNTHINAVDYLCLFFTVCTVWKSSKKEHEVYLEELHQHLMNSQVSYPTAKERREQNLKYLIHQARIDKRRWYHFNTVPSLTEEELRVITRDFWKANKPSSSKIVARSSKDNLSQKRPKSNEKEIPNEQS